MTTALKLAFATFLLLASLGTAWAGPETIDFEGIPAGTIVSEVSGSGGSGPVAVSAQNPGFGAGTNAAVIFDTANPTGGDTDLGTPNADFGGPGLGAGGESGSPFENNTALGNVLIVGENLVDSNNDDLVDDPDDADLVGARIVLDFAAVGPVTISEITILDVEQEEPPAQVVFDGTDGQQTTINLPQTGNNGVAVVVLDPPVSSVGKMTVWINGSGAIDDVVFARDSVCGNGSVDPGEACDDGNDDNFDGCRNDCTLPLCGDGIVDAGEACDDGNDNNLDGCRNNCTLPVCGDGIVDDGEACDDGNTTSGDGCSESCELETVCNLEVIKTATPETIIPGPLPICEKDNKPTSLTFKFTGGGCAASDNDQDAKKAKCTGQVDTDQAVTVAASNKKGSKSFTVDPTTVNLGEEFTISAPKFDADTIAELSNAGGTETNLFHTSCSQPLAVGDVFGSMTLVGINGQGAPDNIVTYDYTVTNLGDPVTNVSVVDDKLGTIASGFDLAAGESQAFSAEAEILETTTNTVNVTSSLLSTGALCEASASATVSVEEPEVPPLSCADGKPRMLVMRYTGESCDATNHTQNADKVACTGDPAFAEPTRIRASDKSNPNDKKAKVWFDSVNATINVADSFTIDAGNGGASRLKAETFVHIFSDGGATLQTVKFHTSCSQPLNVGDQFGSVELIEFVPE